MKGTSKLVNDFSFIENSEDDYFPVEEELRLDFVEDIEPVTYIDRHFEEIFGYDHCTIINQFDADAESNWLIIV